MIFCWERLHDFFVCGGGVSFCEERLRYVSVGDVALFFQLTYS